ncbi:MAG: hypothetical protein ACE5HQ_08865 [Gemmatimonadota bacterium]
MTLDEGSGPESRGRRLRSWKQIARYLDRDIRTVMRWEKQGGMPVHRVPGSTPVRPVFAFTRELDEWLAGSGGAPPETTPDGIRRRWLLWSGLSLVLVLVVLAAWASSFGHRGRPAGEVPDSYRLSASGTRILARNFEGELLWAYEHPEGASFTAPLATRVLDSGAGGHSRLVSVNLRGPGDDDLLHGELLSLSESGTLNWRLALERNLQFGRTSFNPPWVAGILKVVDLNGRPRIAWSVNHYTWWPSVLLILTPDGQVESRFVNSGWIRVITRLPRPAGDLLLVGGISNARAGAMLAVLDPEKPFSSSPEDPDAEFACTSCPEGSPVRYFVFPPTPANRASGLPYNATASIEATSEGIRVVTLEGRPSSGIHWVYLFSREFRLLRSEPGDTYCPELENLLGALASGDPTAECPGDAGTTVHAWTPEEEWRTLHVAAAGTFE